MRKKKTQKLREKPETELSSDKMRTNITICHGRREKFLKVVMKLQRQAARLVDLSLTSLQIFPIIS